MHFCRHSALHFEGIHFCRHIALHFAGIQAFWRHSVLVPGPRNGTQLLKTMPRQGTKNTDRRFSHCASRRRQQPWQITAVNKEIGKTDDGVFGLGIEYQLITLRPTLLVMIIQGIPATMDLNAVPISHPVFGPLLPGQLDLVIKVQCPCI